MSLSIKQNILIPLAIFVSLGVTHLAQAEHVQIAETPLVNSGTSDVLPNIMFVLDNSGSMAWSYTPDWANSSTPWLFSNSAYNTQYYNPAISYTPAVKFDGVSMGNQASPWTSVKNDVTDTGATKGGTVSLVNNADYYAYVPGEYCTTAALTECITSTSATATHKFPATVRWCNSLANSIAPSPANGDCRAIREGSFTNLRVPRATATINFSSTGNRRVSSIKVNGQEILSGQTSSTSNSNDLASFATTNINNCTTNINGNCDTIGFSASRSGSTVTIVSAWGTASTGFTPIVTLTAGGYTSTAFVTVVPGKMEYVNVVSGDNSYPLPGQTAKGTDRIDCSGTVCTYAEEMTNYANWYTYYRTRMQAMKTAASIAFKGIDNRYRVGFITISNQSNNYLPIAKFESGTNGQKSKWYRQLYLTNGSGGTPLRSALSIVGRIYAGKKPVGTADPVEYSCQQNFALLTTDGYWNTDSASDVRDIKGNAIGNLDRTSPRPLYEGPTASSGSLADTAKYYFDTDIRNKADFDNCGNGTSGSDVCGTANDHPKQNMVTLTLGLGIDGTLLYSDDYKDQKAGDFANIRTGSSNWPVPAADSPTAIDDLWHAAVNAGGTYYSAKNPKLLRDSLIKGLSEIKSVFGAGSAAAASSLAPTSGDNFQYVASYRSVKWTGNLEARSVDLDTLKTSETAVWCAENVAGGTCSAPATLKAVTTGGTQTFYCETPGSNADACGDIGGQLGTGGVADACYVEVPTSCTGKMSTLVSEATDSRKIFINNSGALTNFTAGALNPTAQAAFVNGYNSLSQYSDFTTTQQTSSNKVANLVSYLRGQSQFENRNSNPDPEKRLFRAREAILGDITQSKPAYLKKSPLNYVDPGYTAFRDSVGAGRQATVFVGANDGMLHAFNADTGVEMWAFIPTPVIKNLPKLADRDYAIKHTNFVNGNPYLADICVAGCDSGSAQWKTILIGGLNGGGRGYYALDVTNPTSPVMLWEFTAENDSSLGYTFGEPVVTKLSSGPNAGKWVVLLTSGYNNGTLDNNGVTTNSPVGNGQGYLYVLNAFNGSLISKISTGAGSSSSPSGLAKVAAFATDAFKNNFATYAYAGDLEGGLWRFDINNGSVVKVATLRGPGGFTQPITTAPQLGLINKKRVIFVGTGKYLEQEDLINTQVQSVYAIKDDDLAAEITGLRGGGLVMQTLSVTGDFRTASSEAVDFGTGFGWMLDFPAGERVNVDPLLLNGVLLMPTTVPNSTSCLGGGYGWFNYFNYKTGGSPIIAGGVVSEKLNTPAVGFNIVYDQDRKPVVSVVESNDPTPHHLKNKDVAANSDATRETVYEKYDDGTYGRRSIWRELIR